MRSQTSPKLLLIGVLRVVLARHAFKAVQQQTNPRGVDRIANHVHESLDILRRTEAHRHVKYFLCEFDSAFHLGAAAGDDDTRSNQLLEAAAPQLIANQAEEFLVSWLDDLGERLPCEPRGGRSPTLGTSMVSSGFASCDRAQAYLILISSAYCVGVRIDTAMSLVTWSPAIGITAVC